jgi:hypothetical protein
LYNANSISATIDDDNFFKKILNGEIRFANKDKLETKLEITMSFNKEYDDWENKSYKVIKVIKHIKRKEPQELRINTK